MSTGCKDFVHACSYAASDARPWEPAGVGVVSRTHYREDAMRGIGDMPHGKCGFYQIKLDSVATVFCPLGTGKLDVSNLPSVSDCR